MRRASKLHDHNGNSARQRGGKPAQGFEARLVWHEAEQFGDAEAGQGAEKVPENQGAWLGKGAFNSAKDEHCRCTLLG